MAFVDFVRNVIIEVFANLGAIQSLLVTNAAPKTLLGREMVIEVVVLGRLAMLSAKVH